MNLEKIWKITFTEITLITREAAWHCAHWPDKPTADGHGKVQEKYLELLKRMD
jgi:hypothetical protein